MKRKYEKPSALSVSLQKQHTLQNASYNVNSYSKGNDIYAGDNDDNPLVNPS